VRCQESAEEEVFLSPILSRDGVNYNCLRPALNMVFYLGDFMKFAKENLHREAEKLTMPRLAMAEVDLCQFSSLDANMQSCSRESFLEAHVGKNNPIVTESSVYNKYNVTNSQSLGDFPHAGMFRDRRTAFKLNAEQIRSRAAVTTRMITLYWEYMRLQLTTTWNGMEMDLWMSDRVHRCAQCVNRLQGTLCENVSLALDWSTADLADESYSSMQCFLHDEVASAWFSVNAAMCRFNRTGKANPLNLTLIWAMMCSDVLTFLGLHNESWCWKLFPVMVASGMGHLCALTEDGHAARKQCILLSKPNSAGFNAVVIKAVDRFLQLVREVSPAARVYLV
jgi:hypothetical protein